MDEVTEVTIESETGVAKTTLENFEQRNVEAELNSFLTRYENLEVEKTNIADDQKTLLAELEKRGYSKKAFKQLIRDRKEKEKNSEEFLDTVFSLKWYREITKLVPKSNDEEE